MAHRIERVNSLIRQEISELLQRQVKDPRLGNFVSITAVLVSPDLRFARIFVSCLGSEKKKQDILDALAAASGFFRKELARRLRLRRIPELNFQWDDSIERGTNILNILDQIAAENDHQ